MGLLGKNTNKTSFFFVKRQKYNRKVVLFVVFVYLCPRINKMQKYLHEHNN